MLATDYEFVGGRDFDHLLACHFAEEFKTKYKVWREVSLGFYLLVLPAVSVPMFYV